MALYLTRTKNIPLNYLLHQLVGPLNRIPHSPRPLLNPHPRRPPLSLRLARRTGRQVLQHDVVLGAHEIHNAIPIQRGLGPGGRHDAMLAAGNASARELAHRVPEVADSVAGDRAHPLPDALLFPSNPLLAAGASVVLDLQAAQPVEKQRDGTEVGVRERRDLRLGLGARRLPPGLARVSGAVRQAHVVAAPGLQPVLRRQLLRRDAQPLRQQLEHDQPDAVRVAHEAREEGARLLQEFWVRYWVLALAEHCKVTSGVSFLVYFGQIRRGRRRRRALLRETERRTRQIG